MRLSIRHVTSYRYGSPLQYSIQQLRLTPVSSAGQVVVNWGLSAPAKVESSLDAYGNVMQTLVLTQPIDEISFVVAGEVDTLALKNGRLAEGPGRIPLEHFTCATRLTEADDAIRELAAGVEAPDTPAGLLRLAQTIQERVAYQGGITEVSSTAAQALQLGRGVCQDHSHLFIACCRSLGLPARYVSGYIDPGDVPHAASHAWADVWLAAEGWVTIDITHARYASGPYCRIAVGRDYAAASPVRGTRIGGGPETMHVDVHVVTFPPGVDAKLGV